jgi:hypothetical protein
MAQEVQKNDKVEKTCDISYILKKLAEPNEIAAKM